ncbi:MAG: hypothetical protein AUJ32_00265 [Parcubacteria group bacterium CG1_02_40_82]|uniref:Uncharacterized protein n=3 Tax=Candidatus Portnoyibacteriota TaxID=1817913 RepID=A0A2H0KTP5_9BACT|nr:MAG: hypothetical protein AUJ32_00265 [Parcubacteria group bacterium CG1_02_40_82]PIQ75529.1 MAG: hypothetical protein COV84_00800 [Candidatus Portnoybacteria bacterium CG11_big_fil_rev_8_21_14_0_20_40_15]PIS31870.1 MAG: hypothetical protein COT41_00740 [Candidatus Portnoybacteria bacterium CG08_land_8_20_14_0_20_40_83]PIY74479.1 MAG: hypothetical protein COY85_03220 [Candidatus Portnoybacteria bacterium CG_4_10_14_0_8_um_filter_40_50]PJA64840.1 MAG: hypothetical protein CO159_01005 [Candida
MPTAEELYEQQFNEDRARQEQPAVQGRAQQTKAQEPITFPWLMLCVAALFDLISLIPIVNIFSEILAGLILWLWKQSYNSKTNPLIDIVAAKIVDYIFLDILPSNIFTVVYAYTKKKTASKAGSKIGGKIITKLAT